MSVEFPSDSETDRELSLDRDLVIGRLQEYGVEIESEDIEDQDDNTLIGTIVTLATMYDFDMDDILPQITPVDSRTRNDGEVTLAMIYEEESNDEV